MSGIISSIGQGVGSYFSGRAQLKAGKEALLYQMLMYWQQQRELAPYKAASLKSLNELQRLMKEGPGEFKESPGYQFRLEEGIKARERGAAARGSQLSGAQQKALARYGQEYASGEYQNFLSRYYQKLAPYQAALGFTQAPVMAGMQQGTNVANTLASLRLHEGQVRATGYQSAGNLFSNMLDSYGYA